MAKLLSNQLKAVLFLEDMLDTHSPIYQSQCLTVQQFSYQFHRSRDEYGVPFGPTVSVLMEFAVRVVQPTDDKIFYERMRGIHPFPYTFIFNATFNEQRQMTGYEDSMVVHGHVVDLEEVYSDQPLANGTTDQMLVNVKLLLSDVTYEGNTANRLLVISK